MTNASESADVGRAEPTPQSAEAPSQRPWVDRWLISLGVLVIGWISHLLPATWRFVAVLGEEHVKELVENGRPVILASWHNRLGICGHYARTRIVRKGVPIVVLSSLSRDGELLARLARKGGFGVVRGSPTRGGAIGLRRLYRAISRDKCCVGVAPDGSQGPVYKCKPGTVILAQIAGIPILPLAGAAEQAWRLRSWDRMIIPRPFSRVAVAIGEPLAIPQGLESAQVEAQTNLLEQRLDALVDQAQASLDRREPGAGG